MIENRKDRINHYASVLYPFVAEKDYDVVSDLIDRSVDYIKSKSVYSTRSSSDKALGVFVIRKMWESFDGFKKSNIWDYLDLFYSYYDANYDRYKKELIITSADENDLLLSFAIEYINKEYGED